MSQQEIKNLVMILDYNDLEDSSVTIDDLFLNHKEDMDLELQEYILGESLLYGNYFTYQSLDNSLKTKQTQKTMRDSIIVRINDLLECKLLSTELLNKEIIEPLIKLKKQIINNYNNEEKMYAYFKELAAIEFFLINLNEGNVKYNKWDI